MTINIVRTLYRHSPDILRKPIKYIPVKYRLGGRDFCETYSFLKRSETWSRNRLEEYQKEQLRKLLEHAVETVPYYQEIELTHENPFVDLKKFPVVNKETIRNQKDAFKSEEYSAKNTYEIATGGTSGKPFSFILDDSTYGEEWAFIMTGWSRIGYSPGDKLISFRGVDYPKADEGKFWNYHPIYNTYEFSPFHLTEDNLDQYLSKIQKIDPDYIHGYASAITKLARLVEHNRDEFPAICGILAASENIYEAQREIMENTFNTRVFSHYGLSEKVALAAECEESSNYHFYPQYGVTELLNEEGQEVEVGETGEIVATGFLNHSMPFIRYRTGDYAEKQGINTCSCGREYLIANEIRGREQRERSLYIDESNKIPIYFIYFTLHRGSLDNVNSIQFYQKTPGEVTVRIEPDGAPDTVNKEKIIQSLKNKLGCGFEVDIEFVRQIKLTESGKKQLLIQDC
ncbi:hypothetical protein KY092_16390 [Natronomonas gomsonensis]|uniref:phenylacetate--CoA ligase family protein n=1 Tax=Natronomonas gomsonensis TaxID=1046043 RepID=UPI00227A33AA|nr:hypothetical protein [Natronomonas gomsonensis]MCY4732136.1 hypothetical protein [Natronomonas gomsonensis]